MADIPHRIALVYDRVNKWGGAERTLLALHDLFPQAPLYTAVYSPVTAGWAKVFPQVIPTFLNRLPFVRRHHELIPYLTPLAFESFDFSQYEAIISITSADAKGIITRPGTFHLCYCLTPTRYLWSHHREYSSSLSLGVRVLSQPMFAYLRFWDQIAASRPDVYVSISQTVQSRVKKYYSRNSPVVYPPVDISGFSANDKRLKANDYFLWIGRLVPYKHPDLVVRVFNQLGKKLVVVGTGQLEADLRRVALPNVDIKGFLPEAEVASLISHCQALIFFHEEDFGIVPVEAMAAGKPVIGLNRGGVAETVIDGLTGVLVNSDTPTALASAVADFDPADFDRYFIANYARKFSQERFAAEFAKVFTTEWAKYKNLYEASHHLRRLRHQNVARKPGN